MDLWLVNWQAPAERVLLRRGTLGEVSRADGAFRAEVRGPMQGLETVRGRVFTLACDADLGDGRCRVDLPALEVEATVARVDGARLVVRGIGRVAAGWFADGTAVVATGAAAGVRRAVAGHTVEAAGVVLTLRGTVPALAEGDELRLRPGCDKRWATCREKFRNGANFQGFPHLPGNDKALGYARAPS